MKNFIETKELSKDIEYLNKLVLSLLKIEITQIIYLKNKNKNSRKFLKKYQT